MDSRVKVAGHALHPILVVFPLGLLTTAVVFDIIGLFSHNTQWFGISFWMIAAGIIGGLTSAVFGWIDWFAIPDRTRAKMIGLWHGLGNVLMMLLFIASWLLRAAQPMAPGAGALWCSFIGIALGVVTGWLGGELVERLGVGVDDGAHLDSPSSLTHRSATDFVGGYHNLFGRRGKPSA